MLSFAPQAHELLKENHDHAKKELKALREQLQVSNMLRWEEFPF